MTTQDVPIFPERIGRKKEKGKKRKKEEWKPAGQRASYYGIRCIDTATNVFYVGRVHKSALG
jgi:hypothetical protein